MFFVLSKTLGFFAVPSNLIISIGLLGAVLLTTRFHRAGQQLTAGSLVTLAVLGLSPVGNALMLPLEQRFPPWDRGRGAPDGIIVLGGAISPDVSAARNEVALNEFAERMTAAVVLAQRYPAARILFTGGSGALTPDESAEAQIALRLFASFDIARARILVEDRSRNTIENAEFSKEIAQAMPGERWLLVTSAYHMPRAVGAFRKVSFAIEPYPVDWRTSGQADLLGSFQILSGGLQRTDTAVREWAGLVVYWLTGRSSALFPGPS